MGTKNYINGEFKMKYEYYSQNMSPKEGSEFKSQLDSMGGLGWELIQIVNGLAIFKRLVPPINKTKRQLLQEIQDKLPLKLPL